jgi:hypothetical protein
MSKDIGQKLASLSKYAQNIKDRLSTLGLEQGLREFLERDLKKTEKTLNEIKLNLEAKR